jgi:hypothetical protein
VFCNVQQVAEVCVLFPAGRENTQTPHTPHTHTHTHTHKHTNTHTHTHGFRYHSSSRIVCLTLWRLTIPSRCRTAPLTSKRFILYMYSNNIATEYFKHGIYSPFFPLQNVVCFIILTYLFPVLFTFYIQDVLKLKKIIPAPKGLCSRYNDVHSRERSMLHVVYRNTNQLKRSAQISTRLQRITCFVLQNFMFC